MNRLCCILLFLLTGQIASAQSDTVHLPQVLITATKSSLYATGNQQQSFDRSFVVEENISNLSELALKHSPLFINAYGPGLLNSPSARGSGSGHTAILWNGFNIQNSMNGVVDFSLIPIGNFEQIDIDFGGAGALYGNGAIGSTIYLNSQKKIESGWHGHLGTSFGSFSQFEQEGQIRFGTKRSVSSLAISHLAAENDFRYIYNQQKGQQRNSAFQQLAIHQDNSFQLSDNQFLKTFIWYQDSDRGIAPSASEGNSDAFQEDRALRAGFEWSLFKPKSSFKVRSAYFDEYLHFESNLIEGSESYTKALITELENRYELSKGRSINFGFHHTFDHANSNAFEGMKKRNRFAIYSNFKSTYWQNKGLLTASLRQEVAGGKWIPLMPSLGTELQIAKAIQLTAKIAGMYKLPNFNDLYWPELGNQDLLPESGWTAEIGGALKKENVQIKGTVFNSIVDDWILWAPVNGIWRPSNQRSVWARGISGHLDVEKHFGILYFQTVLGYELTRSTIRKKGNQSDPGLVGKQLIHIPIHQFKGTVRLRYKNTSLSYTHLFTGKRFTTTDNSQSTEAFQTGDVLINQVLKTNKHTFHFQFQVNNLMNRNYVILPARPMPMRNYRLQLSFNF